MKYLFILFFSILLSTTSDSQCLDVFDRTCDCPTENDSLVIYNNALKVYEFYEKDPNYVKLKTEKLKTKQMLKNCFYNLEDAVDSFTNRFMLREQVLSGVDLPHVLMPRDGKNIPISDYYQYLDEYRFYEREFENGILNTTSPFPLYDVRIAPLIVNSYENRTSYDDFNGDFVNVALYVPVTIKPVRLLSDSEKVLRKKALEGYVFLKPDVKKVTNINTSTKDSTGKKIPRKINLPQNKPSTLDDVEIKNSSIEYVPPVVRKNYTSPPPNSVPMYYYSSPGNGTLMGYIIGRKFRKYLPTDEYYWALPKWLKEFLNNDKELEKYLKLQLGGWYEGLYTK